MGNKFSVGDIVVANALSNDFYRITNQKNECIVKVLEVYDTTFKGEVVKIKNTIYAHYAGYVERLRMDCFDLKEHEYGITLTFVGGELVG